jgi:tRNA 2-thiouridine synthesizing protein A
MPASSHPALSFDVQEEWDAGDLGCGELVLTLHFKLKAMQPNQVICVHATDPGAPADLPAWCRMTHDTLVHQDPARKLYYIRRKAQ